MRYSTHHKNYQIQNTHKNKLRIQKNKKTQKNNKKLQTYRNKIQINAQNVPFTHLHTQYVA